MTQIIERIEANSAYKEFSVPINNQVPQPTRDAELYLRQDGLIVNAEGWFHPPNLLLGEVMYTPDDQGDKAIFGERYRKVTLFAGTHNPIPYSLRGTELAQIDPNLNQKETNPFFARYKQFFPKSELVAVFPSQRALTKILTKNGLEQEKLSMSLNDMQKLLGIDLSEMSLGVTGSLSLGNYDNLHDFDLVFQGDPRTNLLIARRIRELVRYEKQRRVIEGGKGWNIRFYTDKGILMCCFFGYQNPQEAPLVNFDMDVIEENVAIEGTVSDETHSVYTPTILGLSDVVIKKIAEKSTRGGLGNLKLIIYHTATRGECFEGDHIKAEGALVEVSSQEGKYLALCCIEREAVRNLSPTWNNFYQK